jgi:hypothetical protein
VVFDRLSLLRVAGAAALLAASFGVAPAAWAAGAGTEEARAGVFLSGFEDLPLMPGLSEVAGAGVVFDTPSGRIVEAYAEGSVTSAEVAAFYAGTLPQLGWRSMRAGEFRRENEVLRLEISAADADAAPVTVRFYLSPE